MSPRPPGKKPQKRRPPRKHRQARKAPPKPLRTGQRNPARPIEWPFVEGPVPEEYQEAVADLMLFCDGLDLELDEVAEEKLARYAQRLTEANTIMNLTRGAKTPQELASRHLGDCLVFQACLANVEARRILDVGTGAGLPAIPLAIACPDLEVVALDSTAKKMAFVSKMAEELELPNLKPVVGRAEELGHEKGYREAFDAVVSRATANLPVLLEITVPFLRTAGFLFASKGSRVDEEVESAERAFQELRCGVVSQETYPTMQDELFAMLVVQKAEPTPREFPRPSPARWAAWRFDIECQTVAPCGFPGFDTSSPGFATATPLGPPGSSPRIPMKTFLLFTFLTSRVVAGGIPGFGGLAGGAKADGEARPPPRLPAVQEVPGFDPVRDVPAMENWIPQANVDGAAHCFSISLLTAQFFRRVEFVAAPRRGRSLDDDWSFGDLYRRPLKPDPAEVQLVFETLGVVGPGKVTLAGVPDLRAFTAEDGPGTELFRTVAEAMQFSLQIPIMGLPYAKGVVFSSVDLVQEENFTKEGLNRRAIRSIRERLQEGHLSPFTMHPSTPTADGHVIVAYRAAERDGMVVLTCYDSNYPPVGDRALPTTVTFDTGTGTYEVQNHRGTPIHTSYDLLTAVDPSNYLIRGMGRRIARHLDRYLFLTDRFYRALEDATGKEHVARWEAWKADFLPRWKSTKDDLEERTSWKLRARLKVPR
jgi:16S rRNA (guanine527-N7)-methyltransferase